MEYSNEFKTPYFVVDTMILDGLIQSLRTSLVKYWKTGIIGYSFKTNNVPWIISYMKEKGMYAEVVSSDEFQLAKSLGYKTNQIIFNGPVKGKKEFIDGIENGAIVNIDSKRELEWLLECNKLCDSMIGLRVNFCLEDYCPGETQCGKEDGRFGFSYETGELKNAILFLLEHKIPLSGLHLHCSSKTRSLNIYKAIAKVAAEIINVYNLKLKYIDIGGGYFGGVAGKPTFDDYFSNVYNILNEKIDLKDINLIVEPGMAIIGASMDYVTSVIDTKKTKNNLFVITDGSRIHIDPLMRKKSYSYKIEYKDKTNFQCKQILCGFTCMEGDRFFEIDDQILNEGDKVIFKKVGAYTIGLAPQFIEFHPDIYEVSNNKMSLIQSRRTAEEFIKRRK